MSDTPVQPGAGRPLAAIGRAAGLGVVAGMRSMTAPAAVSRAAVRGRFEGLQGTPLAFVTWPPTARLLRLLALGEYGGDKLPGIPARTNPGPLAGRAGAGALVGAISFRDARLPALAGALCGAGGAVLGSFAGMRARKAIDDATGLPDPLVGAAEDIVAFTLAGVVLRRPVAGLAVLAGAAVALIRTR